MPFWHYNRIITTPLDPVVLILTNNKLMMLLLLLLLSGHLLSLSLP